MTPFLITCETCRAQLRVASAKAIGQILSCPKCQSMVQVVAPPGAHAAIGADAGHNASPAAQAPGEQTARPLPEVATDEFAAASSRALPAEAGGRRIAVLVAVGATIAVVSVGAFALGLFSDDVPRPQPPDRTSAAVGNSIAPRLGADRTEQVGTSPALEASGGDADSLPPSLPDVAPHPAASATNDDSARGRDATMANERSHSGTGEAGPSPNFAQPNSARMKTNRNAGAGAVVAPPRVDRVAKSEAVADNATSAARSSAEIAPPDSKTALPNISKALSTRISIQVRGESLASLLNLVSDLSGVPLLVDPDELATAGVSWNDSISADLNDATLDEVLQQTIGKRGLRHVDRSTYIKIEAAHFALPEVAYPIADLTGGADRVALAEQLANAIRRFIAPSQWRSSGGRGTLRASPMSLHVAQSPKIQSEVAAFLDQLRNELRVQTVGDDKFDRRTAAELPERFRDHVTFTIRDWTTLERLRRTWEEMFGVAIVVDWQALEEEGLSPNARVKCSAIDASIADALTSTLLPIGLDWSINTDSVAEITTRTRMEAATERRRQQIAWMRSWISLVESDSSPAPATP